MRAATKLNVIFNILSSLPLHFSSVSAYAALTTLNVIFADSAATQPFFFEFSYLDFAA